MTENRMRPIHPGEILREEYMEPMELTANALSLALHVPATRIGEILKERRGISPDTALRLAQYFGTDGLPTLNSDGFHRVRREYSMDSTKVSYFGRDNEPIELYTGVASELIAKDSRIQSCKVIVTWWNY